MYSKQWPLYNRNLRLQSPTILRFLVISIQVERTILSDNNVIVHCYFVHMFNRHFDASQSVLNYIFVFHFHTMKACIGLAGSNENSLLCENQRTLFHPYLYDKNVLRSSWIKVFLNKVAWTQPKKCWDICELLPVT